MMIKQDYLIRIIQEIFTAIANMLLKRKKITQKEWSEYEDTAQKILGVNMMQLQTMRAEDILSLYDTQADLEKIELAAMVMLKIADETKDDLLLKTKLQQDGLNILEYVQTHGTTYSLQRQLLINLLKIPR